MVTAAAILLGLSFVGGAPAPAGAEPGFPREGLFPGADVRSAHLVPPASRALSKKEAWLTEKAARRDVHVADSDIDRTLRTSRALATPRRPATRKGPALTLELPPVGTRIEPLTTLYNLRTRESLPILPGRAVEERFHGFLRDHFTNQATRMDTRLIDVLAQVAVKFRAERIEVVSGYRSPKYNLMLRKKGREVARTSQHTQGHAVDFRISGVKTTTLLRYVRSLRRGGVGYYPHSQFVHSDTGKIRFWKGS